MGNGGEWMPNLVIYDGVRALNGDILLKQNLAYVATRYRDMDHLSNSYDNNHMVGLAVTELATC